MASNGDIATMPDETIQNALQELADLEKDFAAVEIDALRQKQYSLSDLYTRRAKHLQSIPNFWPTVLLNGPEEFTSTLSPRDADILQCITELTIERYQILSGSEGEPRSLRFTFTFDKSKNKFFEDEVVVKEFEFKEDAGLVSKPVNLRWTKQGKKMGLGRLLDLAEGLWLAEEALVGSREKGVKKVAVEQGEREGLWQYEKLREELEKVEGEDDAGSWLDWFGYRGAVAVGEKKEVKKEANGDAEEGDSDEEDDDDDGMLDVEIYPAGGEVAEVLAEDLWENVMDYFMRAQAEDELDEDMDSDDDDAPELVEAADFEGFEDDEKPPSKKQRRS
ncbi:hypothetical protein OHC33_008847 [Knufia fluminis]|uniref:Nucleosome assembly protein n=1 Tax=Knufia fluminis TaxID=191047 RepID=A0AAN8I1W8_9EURO|nr:hypothetical protein OHC33_008847 [Knufia fluminis]